MSEQRAVPFYCPFCGEEDLFPAGEKHGTWHCRSCARLFTVHLLGLRTPPVPETPKRPLSVVRDDAQARQ